MLYYIKYLLNLSFVILLLTSIESHAQDQSLTCKDIKDGIFYYYMKNSSDRYMICRNGDFQKEVNLVTGDTAIWEINRIHDCTYSLTYQFGSAKKPLEMMNFLKKHKMVYAITKTTDDYYIFNTYVDKTSSALILTDTMWLREKRDIPNNELFKLVTNETILRKEHFSDTSKYAILYVYRPRKLTNSLSNYLIYFNNIVSCVAKNKSGYIFKILKEGPLEVKSQLYKDESLVKVDVKFGNSYYVKSMVHWGIYSRLYNFKLEMTLMKEPEGKLEFGEVSLQK